MRPDWRRVASLNVPDTSYFRGGVGRAIMLRMLLRVNSKVLSASSMSSVAPPMDTVTVRRASVASTTREFVEYCDV